MNTRRNGIETRLKALEERLTRKHAPPKPSLWSRYWAGPVPNLAEIFGDTDPKMLPPDEVWARIDARLPPVAEEFRNVGPERLYELYRAQIAGQRTEVA
ncbi:hypothetical protein [Geminicoccus flavidas]|uniref:hypothetical protein n=1 Tax=Geminicoccus flavidas TaxID=2506407 RepID=UPI001356B69D|nr:hypothetical protein [Geminicoccus flavidas]